MLTITEQVYSKFLAQASDSYFNRCLELVTSYFPELCAMSDRETMVDQIHRASEHACHLGIGDEPDVYGYIYLHFLLGAGFASKPQYGWLTRILGDERQPPSRRVDAALDEVADRMEADKPMEDPLDADQIRVITDLARLNA